MVRTIKNLSSIQFPVYLLPSSDWEVVDGLLLMEGKILDDRNMLGATLGVRRLQTEFALFPLPTLVWDIVGIIKQRTNYFIDSAGMPFIYEKTKTVSLKYQKIVKVERKGVASIIRLNGVKNALKVIRPPEPGMSWAGVLFLNNYPWVVYDFSEEKKKDTWRKV